jgi:hypothetical protein
MANKEIYQKGKITTLDYGQGFPIFDLNTKAVKYAEMQQIQDLIDNATVSGNSRVFWATYLITDATATAETMIPTAIFDGATLAAGNIILRNATTDKVNNGLWVVQSTGNAIRYNKADSGYGLGRSLTHIRYNGGTNAEGRWYYCITHEPNIDVDSVDFERIYLPNQGLSTTDNVQFATLKSGNVAGGNYSEFEADGTLKFNGNATCYLDAIVPFIYKGGSGEANFATFVGGIKSLQFLTNDFVAFQNTEAPHDYKEGSEIEIHLHWGVNQALIAGNKVQWRLELAFANTINGINTGTIFCDPATPTVFGSKTIDVE